MVISKTYKEVFDNLCLKEAEIECRCVFYKELFGQILYNVWKRFGNLVL